MLEVETLGDQLNVAFPKPPETFKIALPPVPQQLALLIIGSTAKGKETVTNVSSVAVQPNSSVTVTR